MRRPADDRDAPPTGSALAQAHSVPRVVRAPRPAPLLIPRPRLLARLDENAPLTLLRAPVGFGKRTLVAQWVSERDREAVIAWVRVRPGTEAATSFWAEVLRVLADAGLQAVQDPAWHTDKPDFAVLVERTLLTTPGPVVLVVEGFENVTAPDLDVALLDVLRHTPQLRLVVCLRSHRHFPAFRQLDLETVTLTARDLRFTADETADLLTTAGVTVPATTVRALNTDTGGWPEPTRAIALRLREAPDLAEPERMSRLVDEVAADYLRFRPLSETRSPDRVRFATLTSLPETFTTEIAALLTDDHATQSHLEALAGEGLLITEVRSGEVVYRWPKAARRALLVELRRRWPDRMTQLHRRLARWYCDHRDVGPALRHAIDGQDWAVALELIDTSWRRLVHQHEDDLFRAFLAMPVEIAASSPRALALRDTRLQVPDDRLLEAVVLPEAVEELRDLGRRDDAADLLDASVAVILALRMRGAFTRASDYGDRALELAHAVRATRPHSVVDIYPSLQLQVGISRLLADNVPGAMAALQHAYEQSGDSFLTNLESDGAVKLALAHAISGDVVQAGVWLDRYADVKPVPEPWARPLVRSTADAARLLVAVDRLELDTAADLAARLAAHVRRDELWAFLLFAQAQLAFHLGTAGYALSSLDRARRTYQEWRGPDTTARPLLAAVEANLLMSLGRGNQARSVLGGSDGNHSWLFVARARLALLSGQSEIAASIAADTRWERQAPARHRLEMLLIRALAAERLGDRGVAEVALRRVARAAGATGTLRPFTTVPREELTSLAERVAEARELFDGPLADQPSVFPSALTIVELTEREQRVLEGLAGGLTVQQIADISVLSYNTVRTQQRSLYKKLGTSARSTAIARAREWGLLSPTR